MPSERTASAAVADDGAFDIERSVTGTLLSRMGSGFSLVASATWRMARRNPLDSIGAILASAAIAAIATNALFLQTGPHPAPILPGKPRPIAEATGSVAAAQPGTGARDSSAAESAAAPRTRTQVVSDIQRELARRGFFDGMIDGVYGAKTDAAIRDFEQAAGMKPGGQPDEALLRAIARSAVSAPLPAVASPRPPVAIRGAPAAKAVAPAKRVLAVQRALAEFGYGQVRPSGVFGPETKIAIERFERERKLPVTGQISDRLIRELAVVTGRPLE